MHPDCHAGYRVTLSNRQSAEKINSQAARTDTAAITSITSIDVTALATANKAKAPQRATIPAKPETIGLPL